MTTSAPDPAEATRAALVEAVTLAAINVHRQHTGNSLHASIADARRVYRDDMQKRWLEHELARAEAIVGGPLADLAARLTAAERALGKVNTIRNSIIGLQTMNWSEHIYPLVAALEEAGLPGMDYPEARENFGTTLQRAVKAEDALDAAHAETVRLRARVAELEGALRPFANWSTALAADFGDHEDDVIVGGVSRAVVTFGDLRGAARVFASRPVCDPLPAGGDEA